MCTIISIINNKGGVGKTTSTAVLAELLAYLNHHVLVVDLDQQANLSMLLGIYAEESEAVINGFEPPSQCNVADVFKHRFRTAEDVSQAIHPTKIANLDIMPSNARHKATQSILLSNSTGNNNIILKRALNTLKEWYDFIIIDNAPANDILTVNSMFVSDYIYVPVRVEGFSYKGLRETLDTILYIKEEHFLDSIQFGGAFITQAELNTTIYHDLKSSYLEELGSRFLQTPIRKDIKISEIETTYQSVLEYCPGSNAIRDYSKLLLEMNILPESSRQALMNHTAQ